MTAQYLSNTIALNHFAGQPAYDLVVLSPHPDDAALSCGGIIANATAAGKRVAVITLCTGDPPAEAFAWPKVSKAHAEWGLAHLDAMSHRREEDRAALNHLGVDGIWCHVLDDLYIRKIDASLRRIGKLGRMARRIARMWAAGCDDQRLLAYRTWRTAQFAVVIAPLLAVLRPTHVLAPLGAGAHPDHLATCDAAISLCDNTTHLAFYEDFPYVRDQRCLSRRLQYFPLPLIHNDHSVADHIALRIAAIMCYKSQIPALFGSVSQANDAVRTYLTRHGGEASERVWTSPPALGHPA